MRKLSIWTIVIIAVLLLVPVIVLADEAKVYDDLTLGEDGDGLYYYNGVDDRKTYTGILKLLPVSSHSPKCLIVESGDHRVATDNWIVFSGDYSNLDSTSPSLNVAGGASIIFEGGDFYFYPPNTGAPYAIKNDGNVTVKDGSVTATGGRRADAPGDAVSNAKNIAGTVAALQGDEMGVIITPLEVPVPVEEEMTTEYTIEDLFALLLKSVRENNGVTITRDGFNFVFDFAETTSTLALDKTLNMGDFTKAMDVLGVTAVFNCGGNTVKLTGAELIGQFTGAKYRENVRFNESDILKCTYGDMRHVLSIGAE